MQNQWYVWLFSYYFLTKTQSPMITDFVHQILQYYHVHKTMPSMQDLTIANEEDREILSKKGAVFVTLYYLWNIVWSSGNVIELKQNIAEELIENTFQAIHDNRFPNIEHALDLIQVRIDIIEKRILLNVGEIETLNPVKEWVLVIKKDYTKLACILPNISNLLTTWKDFFPILSNKLDETFQETNYIMYKIYTTVYRDEKI